MLSHLIVAALAALAGGWVVYRSYYRIVDLRDRFRSARRSLFGGLFG